MLILAFPSAAAPTCFVCDGTEAHGGYAPTCSQKANGMHWGVALTQAKIACVLQHFPFLRSFLHVGGTKKEQRPLWSYQLAIPAARVHVQHPHAANRVQMSEDTALESDWTANGKTQKQHWWYRGLRWGYYSRKSILWGYIHFALSGNWILTCANSLTRMGNRSWQVEYLHRYWAGESMVGWRLSQTAAACTCAEAQTKWSIHFTSILSANALPNAITQETDHWVMSIVLLSLLLLIMPWSANKSAIRICLNSAMCLKLVLRI